MYERACHETCHVPAVKHSALCDFCGSMISSALPFMRPCLACACVCRAVLGAAVGYMLLSGGQGNPCGSGAVGVNCVTAVFVAQVAQLTAGSHEEGSGSTTHNSTIDKSNGAQPAGDTPEVQDL